MSLDAKEITIAITVYDRRDYIEQAVSSALAQTLPVRVIVVEDCGPDLSLQSFVLSKFGSRITYHRNPRRRGLFDNWNACAELCSTRWLCLLHDDDFLQPTFVEAMIELAEKIPGQGLYYGQCDVVDSSGQVVESPRELPSTMCQQMDLVKAAHRNPLCFPADLFRADYVKALGGFRTNSLFTGDWDMWVRLALHCGAAETGRVIGNYRVHHATGRGTVRVARNGKCMALTFMQRKKIIQMLRQHSMAISFDRTASLNLSPMPVQFLLDNGFGFSPRMLAYNVGLLLRSKSPRGSHLVFKALTRLLGPAFVKTLSRLHCSLKLGQ